MKILFYLSRYPGIGGIERVTDILFDKLLSLGYEVEFISHIQQGEVGQRIVHALPDAQFHYSEANYHFACDIVAKGHFDCIVYQDSYVSTERIVCRLAQKFRLPLFVFEHNSPNSIYIQNYSSIATVRGVLQRLNIIRPLKYRLRKRYLLNHCTKYVLLSKYFIPQFAKLAFCSKCHHKLTYINNPIHLLANPFSEEDWSGIKENIILCVCQINSTKRVDKMVTVWQRLEKQLPDWSFVIVGDGPMKDKIEEFVDDNQIPRVIFTGYSNPTDFYKKAKIFWMMSKFEGWPMTLCECSQYGCVPIAMDSYASLLDIVVNGKTGIVVDKDDYDGFAEKTRNLANDTNMLRTLGLNGMEYCKKYSVNTIIQDWIRLFDRK